MMPIVYGPPSPFALQMRPWLLVVLTTLLFVAAARFAVWDVFGGFFLVLTVGIGWYAVREGMDVTWLLCLAIILFLNSLFDSFILAAHAVRMHHNYFSKEWPWYQNLVHGALLAGPLLEFIGAGLCWSIYKDYISNMFSNEVGENLTEQQERLGFGQMGAQGGGNAGYGVFGQPPNPSEMAMQRQQDQARGFAPRFEAFQGTPHRMCDS